MKDINLLPDEIRAPVQKSLTREEQSSKTMSAAAIAGVISIFVIVILSFIIPKLYLIFLDKQIDTKIQKVNSKEYQEIRILNNSVAAVSSSIDKKRQILDAIDKRSSSITEILNVLNNSAPNGLYITEITFDNDALDVGGYAASSLLVAEFISNIDRLENMNRMGKTESIQFSKANSQYKFKVSFNVGKEGAK